LKALKTFPDVVFATMEQDIVSLGIIESFTDSQNCHKSRVSGAKNDFIRNPTHYHPKLD
jgi:hypothetical protein